MSQREVDRFVYPNEWRKDAARQKKVMLYLAIFAVVSMAFVIFSLLNYAEPEATLFVVPLGLLAIMPFFTRALFWRRASFAAPILVNWAERSVVLSKEMRKSVLVRLLSPAAMFALLLIMYLSREELIADLDDGSADDALVVVSFASPYLAVLLVAYFMLFLLGRRKILGVGLAPEGVYNWWWGGCSFYPWDKIQEFSIPRAPTFGARVNIVPVGAMFEGYSNPEENWLGTRSWIRWGTRKVQLGNTRGHPGLLYQALCFYLRRPELREELGDQRAVERMERGGYAEIAEEIRKHGHALSPAGGDR